MPGNIELECIFESEEGLTFKVGEGICDRIENYSRGFSDLGLIMYCVGRAISKDDIRKWKPLF